MLIRVFRAEPKPGREGELADLVETVSIPFVQRQDGMVACYAGRGIGRSAGEVVMVSIWENVDALKNMTGEDWETEVIPDTREAERIERCSVDHYETVG